LPSRTGVISITAIDPIEAVWYQLRLPGLGHERQIGRSRWVREISA
jgi:hypothetical protein